MYVGGRWSQEKQWAIAQACTILGIGLVVADMQAMARNNEFERLFGLLIRDARVLNAALLLEGYGGQESDVDVALMTGEPVAALAEHPLPVLLERSIGVGRSPALRPRPADRVSGAVVRAAAAGLAGGRRR